MSNKIMKQNNLAPKSILIVEDEEFISTFNKIMLEEKNYKVGTVDSGESAIKILKNQNDIDLVLLDIELGSGIDGIQTAKNILKFTDIPIIFLTSHTEPEFVNKTEQIASYGYIVKGSNIAVLDISIKMAFKLFLSKMNEKKQKEKIKKQKLELEKSNKELNNLIKSISKLIIFFDKKGNIKKVNESLLQTLNYTENEIYNIHIGDILVSLKTKKISDLINLGQVHNYLTNYKSNTGELIPVSITGSVIHNEKNELEGIILIAKDIRTELALKKEYENLQLELINSEKLSTLGHLSAGMAHEINNILSVALSHVQLILLNMKNNTEESENSLNSLNTIEQYIKKCGAIVRNMLAFSKPKMPKMNYCNFSDIINKVIKMQSKRLQLENIEIETNIKYDGIIYVDYTQIELVLLNLIINSRHAILPKGKGKISFILEKERNNILLFIKDNGIGMDKETVKHIFTPFYSTKNDLSKKGLKTTGTGLGLVVSQTIIKNHQGTIEVHSEKDLGTTFIIKIPILKKEEILNFKNDNVQESETIKNINCFEKKKLNVLIIDDETDFVSAFSQLLKKNNCIVENCISAYDGIRLSKEKKFDLIFLDLIMPNISGIDVYKKIKKNNMNMNIVIMSGDLDFKRNKNITKLEPYDYLQKPIDNNDLIMVLNKYKTIK